MSPQTPTPPAQAKRRVLEGSVYSERQHDGFWHLGCTCNQFRTTPAGNLSWCAHVGMVVTEHKDQERLGFNARGVETDIHITLRPNKPYLDTVVRVAEPDHAGMRLVSISSVLQGHDVDLDFDLGFIPEQLGRSAIIPLIRDWINEHMEQLRDIGCRHDAHSRSRYDCMEWEKIEKKDPLLWADLLDIATRATCRVCRELDEAQDLPF